MLLRAPAYRTPSEASPRRRRGHASRFLCGVRSDDLDSTPQGSIHCAGADNRTPIRHFIYIYIYIYAYVCPNPTLVVLGGRSRVIHDLAPPPSLQNPDRVNPSSLHATRGDAIMVRELADSPPLACMFARSHLYFTCIPPVSHTISLVSPCPLAFTRYCHHQYCIVHGIQKEGSVRGRILPNGRAIVLQ